MKFFLKSYLLLTLYITATYAVEKKFEGEVNEPTKNLALKVQTNQNNIEILKYDDFKVIRLMKDLFFLCMPKVKQEDLDKALSIYGSLLRDGNTPIQEDDGGDATQIELKELYKKGVVKHEGGYSFPPSIKHQGPFLAYCGNNNFKRILDIGSGSGNDTISLLLTRNVQVVAVDIHEKQLNVLKQRVQSRFEGSPEIIEKGKFATLKRDFSLETTKVPPQYFGKFQGANLNRVLHFLDEKGISTLLANLNLMLEKGALVSVTVLTFTDGSKENEWYNSQKEKGLPNPGLIYYDHITRIKDNFPQTLNIEFRARDKADLSGPNKKREFAVRRDKYVEHIKTQGRFFQTLETLTEFLNPYFNILDHTVFSYYEEQLMFVFK